ncbi:WXG100 family type VII secretion target [Defluviitalea phaphyphila]|uniref:WXG100 family type VII secretion target n=1 Tax=Defluviitalea phaphyphila TaxID=1473580 RepID=UPI000730885B|nr:WXG100 family type VII secretion target [Defluviitalea phaphyphila]
MRQSYTIIETNNIKNKVREIKKIKEDYEQLLTNLNSIIDGLQNYWEGGTYDILKQQYEEFKKVIEKFKTSIEHLSSKIENIAINCEIADEKYGKCNK